MLCPSAVVAKTTKVKKEITVKAEGEEVVKQEEVAAEVSEIKAEDVDVVVGDIEDIGKTPGRRTPRKRA
jgi:endonuclease-3